MHISDEYDYAKEMNWSRYLDYRQHCPTQWECEQIGCMLGIQYKDFISIEDLVKLDKIPAKTLGIVSPVVDPGIAFVGLAEKYFS